MKKILYSIIVAVLALSSSCKNNPLDITPDGRLGIDAIFKDEVLTQAYLNTTYASIPFYFWRYNSQNFLAGISDEAKDADVGNVVASLSSITQFNNGALTVSTNPIAELQYANWWVGIRNANVFLTNIDAASVADPILKSRFKAEAQVLRAFYYWELIKQYGPLPIVDKPFDNTFDYSTLQRPTFQQVVDFIVKDCNAAIANPDLPVRITLAGERGRFTKAIAYAIKAQALLYNASPLWNTSNDQQKWTAAADASREALTALTAGGQYALAANYGDYFLNTSDISVSPNDKETIFERPDVSETNFINFNALPTKGGVKAGVCPSQELVDSYDMQATGEPAITGYTDDDHLQPIINTASGYSESNPYAGRDPRFYATIWYNGASYATIGTTTRALEIYTGGREQLIKTPPNRTFTHTGYYLRKFIDPKLQSGATQSARWKKYRLAELYLNLAEAANEAQATPNTEVYNAINTIRRRVQMPDLPAGLSKEQMRERIRRERRVELAIEEHRLWDVRRWKMLDQTDRLVTGMEITRSATNVLTYKRFVADRRNAYQSRFLLFPIPLTDVSIIPSFGKNQNPGW